MQTTSKFGTGAVRSKDAEATRYDLISPIGLAAVAETYAEGAAKYSDFNWERGMPVHDLLNHGLRHVYLYLSGDRSEPHLAHAAWNLLSAIHSEKLWPHLNEGTLRGPGCTPPKDEPVAEVPASHSAEVIREAAERVKSREAKRLMEEAWHGSNWRPAFSRWIIDGKPAALLGGDGASEPAVKTLWGDVPIGKPLEIPIMAFGVKIGTYTGQATVQAKPQASEPPKAPGSPVVALADVPRDSVTLYLSGPMTGVPDNNFPMFDRVAAVLRHRGWRVINPADFGAEGTRESHLRRDINLVIDCDVLVQLPEWEQSKGSRLEHAIAEHFNKRVASLAEILDLG